MNAMSSGAEKIRKALELRRGSGAGGTVGDAPQPSGFSRQTSTLGVATDAPVPAAPQAPASTVTISPRVCAVDANVLRNHRVLLRDDRGFTAQAFRALRTQVVQAMGRAGYRSLAVVSPATCDGRTTTAINLAVSIAEDPERSCLLVDLDLRRPRIAEWFGAAASPDVVSCLQAHAPVESALVRPQGFGKLLLLPAKDALPSSEALLAAESTRRMVKELHERYANRIVMYDLPPLLETADALAFLPNVDAALLVVREGRARREDVLRCLDLLGDTVVVGTVLTAARDVRGF